MMSSNTGASRSKCLHFPVCVSREFVGEYSPRFKCCRACLCAEQEHCADLLEMDQWDVEACPLVAHWPQTAQPNNKRQAN